MAWTQTDIEILETAIKQGARTVQFGDKSVTYHSLDEMLKLRTAMQAAVGGSGAGKVSSRLVRFDRG